MPEWIKLTYIYGLKYTAKLDRVHMNVEGDKVVAHHYIFVRSQSKYPSVQEYINKLRNK